MERVAMVCLAALGSLCIYAGYRLFCDLPAIRGGGHANWKAIVFLNIVPGAALALLGTILLTTEARAIASQPAPVRRQGPTSSGAAARESAPGHHAGPA